ncbi:MAG: hypothetical protein M0R73_11925 [Dehalococcoidia bacterium]|nr:hypothetical protein [Dehalococcoidia bacterium]
MSSPPTGTRFRRGRLILRLLDRAEGAAGNAWREQRAALWAMAREALPYVVERSVEMPMVHGLDVGPRIIYDRPPPYEHAIEYVQAAANGYSFDDPRGWYEAEAAARSVERIRDYQRAVAGLCAAWGLNEPWAQRMIVHQHLRAVAEGDPAAGEAALDMLAGTSADEGAASDPALATEVRALLERGFN